jgi:3-hydroxypropanoate dehydrogenase
MGSVEPLRAAGGFAPAWAPRAISRDLLEEVHALMSLGPAQVDASPTRVLFLTTEHAKARLEAHLPIEAYLQARAAPAVAIVGYDVDFAEQLVEFIPHVSGLPSCFDQPDAARRTAMRNRDLQAMYLFIAAQAVGLCRAPIPDFDAAGVSREFFPRQRLTVVHLCSLGFASQPQRSLLGDTAAAGAFGPPA